MSMIARRAAFAAARTPLRLARRGYAEAAPAGATGTGGEAKRVDLRQGARRDPELYILLAIMTGAFALAGWHFSRNPTTASSEHKVAKAEHSEPWKTGGSAAYQYHPHGDPRQGKKDAPSALNEVIIPNVTLPKVAHERFNKYGKDL